MQSICLVILCLCASNGVSLTEGEIWSVMNGAWSPDWEHWPRMGFCRENKSLLDDIPNEVCVKRKCVISWKIATLVDLDQLLTTSDPVALTYQGNLHECALPSGGQITSDTIPEISFIFTLHNSDKVSARSILEVFRTAHEVSSAEFIILNDGSTEDMSVTYRLLQLLKDLFNTRIKIIEHQTSQGYGISNNHALESAQGVYAILLNSDVIVLPGWLTMLHRTIRSDPERIGMVGPLFLSHDGTVGEAGGMLFRYGLPHNMGRGLQVNQLSLYNKRIVDYISAACVIFNRTLFHKLGLFDSQFQPAYYEDTDASMQFAQYGFSTVLQPLAVVIHYEGQTISSTEKFALMNVHKELFQSKHKNLMENYCPDRPSNCPQSVSVHDLHAQQTFLRQSNRALILDSIPPEPDRDAASFRLIEVIQILKSLSFSLSFEPLSGDRHIKYIIKLLDEGVNYLAPGMLKELADSADHHGIRSTEIMCPWKFIYVCRREVFFRHIRSIKRICPSAPIIFDTVGLQYLRETRKIELENREIIDFYADQPEEGLKLLQARKKSAISAAIETRTEREISLIGVANISFVMTTKELDAVKKVFPDKDVRILSGIYPLPETLPPSDPVMRNGILFVGNLCTSTNIAALNFILDEILLDRQFPFGFKMHIVSTENPLCPANTPILDKLREHRLVEIHRSISDAELVDLHNRVKIVIAPLRNIAGAASKILHACSLGVPVISTSVAFEGLRFQDGRDIIAADTGSEFYDTIMRLYQDVELWQRIRTGGFVNVKRHYSRAVAVGELTRTINDLGTTMDPIPWRCPYDLESECPSLLKSNQLVMTCSINPNLLMTPHPDAHQQEIFILESLYPWLRNKTSSIVRGRKKKSKKNLEDLLNIGLRR
jgi:O-antigen biosynthesis protein